MVNKPEDSAIKALDGINGIHKRRAENNPGAPRRAKRGSALSRADGAPPLSWRTGQDRPVGIWYVATWREQWVAQLSLSAAALKCGVRDRWIGWDFRSQYGRLNLIANNSRFLILPGWNRPNVGSDVLSTLAPRVLSLTERRVNADWRTRFGHPLLLLETFVDPLVQELKAH